MGWRVLTHFSVVVGVTESVLGVLEGTFHSSCESCGVRCERNATTFLQDSQYPRKDIIHVGALNSFETNRQR